MTHMSAAKTPLEGVLELGEPLDDILAQLEKFEPPQGSGSVIRLERSHLQRALNLYLEGKLSADDVESWATVIEGSNELKGHADDEELLRRVIHQMANPYITQELTPDSARELLERLNVK